MKYNLKCAYCDSNFESGRSDAIYCSDSCRTMNSRDKKQKEKSMGSYTLEYDTDENQLISKKAALVGMAIQEYIKFISLNNVKDYSNLIMDNNHSNEENKKLKAKLSFYTEDLDQGVYLNITVEKLMSIYEEMDRFGRPFSAVEDYIVYASLNLKQIMDDTIKSMVVEFKRNRLTK